MFITKGGDFGGRQGGGGSGGGATQENEPGASVQNPENSHLETKVSSRSGAKSPPSLLLACKL